MNDLLNYFLEANLYLISIYIMYELLLVRDKHFQFNRAFVLLGVLLSLVLPSISIPVQNAAVTGEFSVMLPVLTITAAQEQSVTWLMDWVQIIGAIYFGGVLITAFLLTRQIFRLLKHLPKRGTMRQQNNGYTLITTNGEIPTCSFFGYLFWDSSAKLTELEKRQILDHELTHIRQWHSVDILFIEILRVIFWFNPATYLLKSRLTEVHEYLADRGATNPESIEEYSKLLSLQVFRSYDISFTNHFHQSQILKRITMLKTKEGKSLWTNIALLLPMLALIITVFSCETGKDEVNSESTPVTVIPPEASAEAPAGGDNGANEIFMVVEDQPEPPGGMAAFAEYVGSQIKYPEEAKKLGIEGQVYVQFIVAEDGKLSDVVAVKGIGGGCDEEAVRVVKESPIWKPGEQRGHKVKVRLILPITFKLG